MEPMGVAGARAPESAEAQRPSGVVALGLGEHLRHGATPQLALTRTRTPAATTINRCDTSTPHHFPTCLAHEHGPKPSPTTKLTLDP